MPSAVRALVYDPLSKYLAVGHGDRISVYSSRPAGGLGVEHWNCIEEVSPPGKRDGSDSSLVMCAAFFGASHRRRHLFVGYARAGFLYVALFIYLFVQLITYSNEQCLDVAWELCAYTYR
jgi:hypothetical protein